MIGFENKEIQKKYNDVIRKDIFDFIIEAQKEIARYRKEAIKNDFPVHQCSVFVDYRIYKKERDFLSIILELYKYTGGAHGITKRISYNMDMFTGDILTLSDFIKNADISKEEINSIIKKKIDNEPDKYFSDKMGFKSVADDQGFYLKDDKLVIFFQLYEIASYASGFPEFVIQLNNHK